MGPQHSYALQDCTCQEGKRHGKDAVGKCSSDNSTLACGLYQATTSGSQDLPLIPVVVCQNMDWGVIRLGQLKNEVLKRLSSEHDETSGAPKKY